MTACQSKRAARKRLFLAGAATAVVLCAMAFAGLYGRAGWYGFNVALRRGGTTWQNVTPGSPALPPSMRMALQEPVPRAEAGPFQWRQLTAGFEVAEMPVIADGNEVDRVLLARVDPSRFRFEVRNRAAGDKGLDDWMTDPRAILVINGSYYARDGLPDTPFVSDGVRMGPTEYDATHGAFVATDTATSIHDLANENWRTALAGARDAMVSYPLLLAADGSSRVKADRRWLANRSFVAQDHAGRIILGTTRQAFFSLERLGLFLREAPLGLTTALNLDGGPVACQAIALADFHRRFCGQWATQTTGETIRLLGWRFGSWALPIVLVVVPR